MTNEETKEIIDRAEDEYDRLKDRVHDLFDENKQLKADLQEANDNATWWHNRWQSEHKQLEEASKRIGKATGYLTSYESISLIQGLERIDHNKGLDKKTMEEMVRRYLIVHDRMLAILEGEDNE